MSESLDYETFYGFARSPFTLAPDPQFLYLSESHDEAIRLLLQSLRRKEGFIVLTGDIGTGKTTLCRALLQKLDTSVFTSLILDPFMSVEELLREVLLDFGVASRTTRLAGASRHELVTTLHDFLLSLIPIRGSCVLVIDEAQHLAPEVLEQIRVLSNLETDSEKLLQIVLIGQLNLLDALAAADMRQLDQRISLRARLRPLTPEEVRHYIAHRLDVARGTTEVGFLPEAAGWVHALTGGIPRVINLLCDRALMIAAERGVTEITPDIIDDAADRLELKAAPRDRRTWLPRGRRAAAVGVALALVASALVFAPLSRLVDAPPPALPPAPQVSKAPVLRPLPLPPDVPPPAPPRPRRAPLPPA